MAPVHESFFFFLLSHAFTWAWSLSTGVVQCILNPTSISKRPRGGPSPHKPENQEKTVQFHSWLAIPLPEAELQLPSEFQGRGIWNTVLPYHTDCNSLFLLNNPSPRVGFADVRWGAYKLRRMKIYKPPREPPAWHRQVGSYRQMAAGTGPAM